MTKSMTGLDSRIWTHDSLLPKQVLYQAELYPDIGEKNDKEYFRYGTKRRTRTDYTLINIQMLYRMSYFSDGIFVCTTPNG